MLEDQLLNVRQAAEFLGLGVPTMNRWRTEGGGPPYLKLGSRVLYRKSSLLDWLSTRECRSTSCSLR